MSKDKNKKGKIFVKKKDNVTEDKNDDFFEYDKIKSNNKTIHEDFFENIQSIDYNEVKIEKEKAQNERKVFSSEEMIEDEVIQYTKKDITDDDILKEKNVEIEDEIELYSGDNVEQEESDNENTKIITKDELSQREQDDSYDKKDNSIFEEFAISQTDGYEKKSDKYDSLFEDNFETDQNINKTESLERTDVIDVINNRFYDDFDDDDFGSIDDYKNYDSQENYNYEDEDDFGSLDSEYDKTGYINVSQRANYYSDEDTNDDIDYADDEDDYFVDKKGRKKKKRRFRFVFKIFIFLIISIVSMSIYFGLTHDLFKIDYVQVTGNVANEKEIIVHKSGVSIGDNIFLTRASKIVKNLKEIGNIEDVKVTKNYPNIIIIDIKENYVGAYINDANGITTIDNYGKVKAIKAENSAISGIQIKGLSDTDFKVGEDFSKDSEKVKMILEIMTRRYYGNVLSVDFSSSDIVLEMKNSLKISFGTINDYSKKLKVIDVLLKKIQTDGINASEIILNVGDNPIIVKK